MSLAADRILRQRTLHFGSCKLPPKHNRRARLPNKPLVTKILISASGSGNATRKPAGPWRMNQSTSLSLPLMRG
jgi:hypothetical protein